MHQKWTSQMASVWFPLNIRYPVVIGLSRKLSNEQWATKVSLSLLACIFYGSRGLDFCDPLCCMCFIHLIIIRIELISWYPKHV